MSLQLKSQVLKLAFGAYHVVRYTWKLFVLIIVYGIAKPLAWLWSGIFMFIGIPVYRQYLRIMQRVQKSFAGSKSSWWYPIATRYLLHVVIISVIFGVLTNNVLARETAVEDFGSGTLVNSLLYNQEADEEYVEYAVTTPSYALTSITREGAIDRYHRTSEETELQRAMLAIVRNEDSGEAVAKANIPTTSELGVPRDQVREYVVEGGDTISTIASQFAVSTNTLLWANNLNDSSVIKPGQTLKIPPVTGVVHAVQSGDTVASLAKKYEAKEDEILEFNRLADASAIEVGQQLIIPGGRIEPPPPPPTPVRTTQLASSGGGTVARPASAVNVGAGMFWPTPGHRINQGYSARHTGLDIDTARSPIYASDGGRVVRTNWGTGYGNNIIIDHGNGLQTLYAHLSKSYVGVGQSVSKGETIGISGCTGWCTGDHLHFEVWVNGRRTNPFNYF